MIDDKPSPFVSADAEAAQCVRDALGPLLREVCEVLDRAQAAGLDVNFQINRDQFGKRVVQNLSIVKPL